MAASIYLYRQKEDDIMITVDLSNIWGPISLPDLLAMEGTVAQAHQALFGGQDGQLPPWLSQLSVAPGAQTAHILEVAKKLRDQSEICVVIALGGAALGSQGVIEALQGPDRNLGRGKKGDPILLYAGSSLSTRAWNDLRQKLEGKDFSLIVISRSGTTLETALTLRGLRWLLERKYGTEEARCRVVAVTDPCAGALWETARDQGWETFSLGADVTGRFSLLTPAGLLPMAVAGLDIDGFLQGAADAREGCTLGSFENGLWQYAAVRNLLHRGGRDIGLFAACEPSLRTYQRWWQQLFAQTEGKGGQGIFPVPLVLPEDLHCLGQLIQQGKRNLFETLVRFEPTEKCAFVDADWKNLDGFDYLEGKPWDWVEAKVYQGTLDAHVDGDVPVITMDCGPLDERALGELSLFMTLAALLCAQIAGVEPWGQPGMAAYQQNMYTLLGRPGYTEETNKNPL